MEKTTKTGKKRDRDILLKQIRNLVLTDSSEDSDHENIPVRNTQLSETISKLRRKYGIKEGENGFSWHDIKLEDGKQLLPQALDQKASGLCIVYSLFGLFCFQKALLASQVEDLGELLPSFHFMRRVFYGLDKDTERTLQHYLGKLSNENIAANDEYDDTGRKLRQGRMRKFSIDWSYNICSHDEDMVKKTQRAIKRFGGVIMEIEVADSEKNENEYVIADEVAGATPATETSSTSEGKGKKRKTKTLKQADLGHAVFAYGWRYDEDGKVIFKYLNSHGPEVGDNGHEELANLQHINHVYVVQLTFNASGF